MAIYMYYGRLFRPMWDITYTNWFLLWIWSYPMLKLPFSSLPWCGCSNHKSTLSQHNPTILNWMCKAHEINQWVFISTHLFAIFWHILICMLPITYQLLLFNWWFAKVFLKSVDMLVTNNDIGWAIHILGRKCKYSKIIFRLSPRPNTQYFSRYYVCHNCMFTYRFSSFIGHNISITCIHFEEK